MLRFSSNSGGDAVKLLNDKGFTLIEIAITIAVVGIVGVSFAGFFINSARMISAVDEREEAMMIAQSKMEELKSKEFSGIKSDVDGGKYEVKSGIYSKEFKPENKNYEGIIKIEEANSNLYKIMVEIFWDDNSNLNIKSYITKKR